jgi:FkbM family methyltransferase
VYLEQSYAPLVAIAREVLAPGSRPIIVDGGANVGFASIWLHDALQPDELIAVECDGENFEILQAHISANLRTGVQCVFGALWSNDHWLGVERDFRDGRSWSRRAQPGSRSDVKGVTLVDHERVIDVLKLDIEGTEFELFEDRDTFDTICNRTRIIGLEIHPDAGDSEALRKKLAQHFCLSEFGELTCGVNTKLC